MERKPVLVTISGGTASGKSFLYNHIRDIKKFPCLISTTTRQKRPGEVEGLDYFYITETESKKLDEKNLFAELAIYNNTRYGVTKEEFHSKLSQGLCFLICEPTGVEHYARPAVDAGARHLKIYVHTDPEIRFSRFIDRTMKEVEQHWALGVAVTQKTVKTALTRLQSMLTEEMQWGEVVKYDRTVFGIDNPEYNLEIILNEIEKLHAHDLDVAEFNERKYSGPL